MTDRTKNNQEHFVTLRRAAALASVSEVTLRREVKSGRLRAYRVGGRRAIRLRPADVDAWLEAGRDGATVWRIA